MKVLLRLRGVEDQAASQLTRAHCGSPEAPERFNRIYMFMDLKSLRFDGNNQAEVDLVLETEFLSEKELLKEEDVQKKEPVTREMVGELFDLLDIFPPRSSQAEFIETILCSLNHVQIVAEGLHPGEERTEIINEVGKLKTIVKAKSTIAPVS